MSINSNNQAKTQDTMIIFKSTRKSQTKTGKDGLTLSLDTDNLKSIIAELQKHLDNERGAKIAVYTGTKETQDGGRSFESSIAFVSGIQEFGANRGANTGSVKYVKKTTASYDEEKVAKVKRELA